MANREFGVDGVVDVFADAIVAWADQRSPPATSRMILPPHGATYRVVVRPEDGLVKDMISLRPITTWLMYSIKSAGKRKLICTTPATIAGAAPAYRTSAYS